VTVAAGSTINPFAAAPNFGSISPFNSQTVNVSTYAIDAVTLDFI